MFEPAAFCQGASEDCRMRSPGACLCSTQLLAFQLRVWMFLRQVCSIKQHFQVSSSPLKATSGNDPTTNMHYRLSQQEVHFTSAHTSSSHFTQQPHSKVEHRVSLTRSLQDFTLQASP